MSADQEVKIAIDNSFMQSVCGCGVGFLRFKRDSKVETATPGGTGTLAKLGKVYGILTAGHVPQPMANGRIWS
jgi:hypothetical protein